MISDSKSVQEVRQRRLLFCGIDVAKDNFVGQLMNPEGDKVGRPFSCSMTRAGFEKCLGLIVATTTVVGLESTGNYGKNLMGFLRSRGVTVLEHNPLKTKQEEKRRVRKVKTDPANAADIAEVTRREYFKQPEYLIDHTKLAGAKALLRARQGLEDMSTKLKHQIHAHLVVANPGLPRCFGNLWSNSGRLVLKKWPTLQRLEAAGLESVAQALRKVSGGKSSNDKVREIMLKCNEHWVDEKLAHEHGLIIKALAALLDDIDDRMDSIDLKISTRLPDEEVELLETINGVGTLTASIVISEMGQKENFSNAKKAVAFVGLDPSVRQSGKWEGKSRISKRGSPQLRRAICNVIPSATKHNAVIRTIYLKQLLRGRAKRDALTICARHLTLIIYAVRKNNRAFYIPEGIPEKLHRLEMRAIAEGVIKEREARASSLAPLRANLV